MTPQLLRAATGCSEQAAEVFAPLITEACALYEINTPVRLADFLAQVSHESGSLKWVREIWGPTPAQRRYEGRADLGNVEPGDGERFPGRGLIQTTGRFNYAAVRDRLRARLPATTIVPDFEAEPEALEQPRWAALSAADYWDWRGLNALADSGDFEAQTRKINGGLNGLPDRKLRRARATKALTGVSTEEIIMPLPAFAAIALPALIEAIPKLGRIFGSGSEVAERNAKAAELAVAIVQEAVGARNAQEAVETVKADPTAAQAAASAVEARWMELTEAGGGGIDGARKADAAFAASGAKAWESPSFWFLVGAMPLVYVVVLAVMGVIGKGEFTSELQSAVVTMVVSLVLGGAAGYYWGATTTRNRATP